jgi:hypothetical protein
MILTVRWPPDIAGPRRPDEITRRGGLDQRRSRRAGGFDGESEGRWPMSEQPRGVDHATVEDEHTWTEQIEIVGSELV